MASGRTHAAIATVALVAVPVALAIWPVAPIVPVTVGLLAGLFVTPDLDLPMRTHEERRWLIGPVLRLVFWPYAKRGKHRDWRHWPILGTLARAGYLGAWFWLALVLLSARWPTVPMEWLGWGFAGWVAQDVLHWVMDLRI